MTLLGGGRYLFNWNSSKKMNFNQYKLMGAETMSLIEAGEPFTQWQELSLYHRIVSCGVRTGHCQFAFAFHAFMQNLNCLPLKLRANKCIPGGKSYFVRNLKLECPRNSSSYLREIPEMLLFSTGMLFTMQFRRQMVHLYSSYTFWVRVIVSEEI